MNFKDFYPFNGREVRDPELRARKTRIDTLFQTLEALEAGIATSQSPEEILMECSSIIDEEMERAEENTGAKKENEISPIIIAALSAVMMKMKSNMGLTEEIAEEYSNFVKLSSVNVGIIEAMMSGMMPDLEYGSPHAALNAALFTGELAEKLPRALPLKAETPVAEMNVVDVLANASFVAGSQDSQRIRKLFFDLWQIELLQPMLTVMAYATQGYYVDHTGNFTNDEARKLKFIFINELMSLPGAKDSDADAHGISFGNFIYISVGTKTQVNIDTYLRAIAAHEIHHFYEKLLHNRTEPSLPTPYPVAGCSEEKRSELDLMIGEISELRKSPPSYIQVSSLVLDKESFLANKFALPNHTFTSAITHYKQNSLVRDSEIVVRTSEALAWLHSKGLNAQESLELLQSLGLRTCCDFFMREVEEMRRMTAILAENSGITFVEVPQYFCEVPQYFCDVPQYFCDVPPYADYRSTPLHEAARASIASGEYAEFCQLVATLRGQDSRSASALKIPDSLGEHPLSLALRHGNPDLVFAFLPLLPLAESPVDLLQIVSFMASIELDESSSHHDEVRAIFKKTLEAELGRSIEAKIFRTIAAENMAKPPASFKASTTGSLAKSQRMGEEFFI